MSCPACGHCAPSPVLCDASTQTDPVLASPVARPSSTKLVRRPSRTDKIGLGSSRHLKSEPDPPAFRPLFVPNAEWVQQHLLEDLQGDSKPFYRVRVNLPDVG